ncbi:hypothetical protein ACJ77P_00295 [Syntrophus buswellii]
MKRGNSGGSRRLRSLAAVSGRKSVDLYGAWMRNGSLAIFEVTR